MKTYKIKIFIESLNDFILIGDFDNFNKALRFMRNIENWRSFHYADIIYTK